LSAQLYTASSGIKVLFGPQKVEEFRELSAVHAEAIVRQAVMMADYVVVDFPSLPSEAHQAVAQLADLFAVVLEPESSSVQVAKMAFRCLRQWGVDGARAGAVVCNRSGATTTLSLPEIRSQLGCEILGVVPYAGEAFAAAMGQGIPIVLFRPDTMTASALRDMAIRLAAETIVGIKM
jgi:MinD-like ATPase involved in chromosome partitioning or flagellar assembly